MDINAVTRILIRAISKNYNNFFLSMPDQYKIDFNERNFKENYHRLKIFINIFFVWFVLLVLMDILYMHELSTFNNQQSFLLIDIVTIVLLLIYLGLFQIKIIDRPSISPFIKRSMVDMGILIILSISTIISSIEMNMNPGMPTYMVAVFIISTTFLYSGLKLLVFFSMSTIVLFFLLFHQHHFSPVFLIQYVAYFGLIILAWINSRIIYRARIINFLKEKDLWESNHHLKNEMQIRIKTEIELNQAKETLEKRVEERTLDLQKFIKKLEREARKRKKVEEQIRKSLEEKEVLLREVNHRVKNNLQIIQSLLNMQARTISDKKIRQLFEYSKNRIQTMAMVHEHLFHADHFSKIKMSDYLLKIATSFDYHLEQPGKIIKLKIIIEPVLIPPDDAVFYGLILNELLTNVIQHAFPNEWEGNPEVNIEFNLLETGDCRLIVKDNGIGMSQKFQEDDTEHIGMTLVQILAEKQLGGTYIIENDHGLKVTVTIPFKKE